MAAVVLHFTFLLSTNPMKRLQQPQSRPFKHTDASVCPLPVYSPRISLDMMTVKMGAELFTVSANDTATFFRLTKPRTTVVNLTNRDKDEDTGSGLEFAFVFVNSLSLHYFFSSYWVIC